MHGALKFLTILMVGLWTTAGAADDKTTCLSAGDSSAAILACDKVIASGQLKDNELTSAYSWRGFHLNNKGEYDRALADISEAIRRAPGRGIVYHNRASIYARKGEHDRVIADLNKAVELGHKNHQLYATRGASYIHKNEIDRAIADLTEAIRLDPKYTYAYLQRGNAYNRKGEHNRSFSDYDQAVRLDPQRSEGFRGRGNSYNRKGEYDRSIADFNEAIRLYPKDASAYAGRAGSLARTGDYDRALADADEAIKLDPKLASAYNNRGFILNSKGEYNRALADLNESIRLNPNSGFAFKNRAISYENKSEFAKALADFRTARNLNVHTFEIAEHEAVEGEKRTEQKLAALGRPAPATPTTAEIRVALVVGNGNYRHATRLPNPANDAADVAQVLRRLGFDVVEGRDLDKRGLEDKLREFGRKLDRAGMALFFYAGHGMQLGGRNYLIPIDAKLERVGDLSLDTIDVSQVLAQMEAEQRVNLDFLDACRDNPLARTFARALGTRSASVGQGLASIQGAIGTMIAYATQPDAVALDGEGRNSPFTTALIKHIATPGQDIGVIMRRVRTDVVQVTRGKQVPWDHSSLMGEVVLAR